MKLLKKFLNYVILNLRQKELLKNYFSLKKNQYLSYDDNKKRELFKLNNLLTHAYNHVPYYHKLFKELDIVINDKVKFSTIEDLSQIPTLSKDIICFEKNNMYSDDMSKRDSYKNSSGGSTGKPVTFLQDAVYALSNRVNTQLAYSWRGHGIYDEMVVIWGAERDIFDGKKSLKSYLLDIYYNRWVLNSFKMSEDDMRRYILFLNKKKPKLIKAYAHSIYEIAKFAKKNNIKVEPQQAIHLAAGTVYESMRLLIEEVFSCKAYNYYGSREVGSIASECSAQNGLHIMQEHTLVEIINSDGDPCKVGERGEVVVTTLQNYSMPLIRYKIGDIAVRGDNTLCSCGCTYSKLEKVVGRTTDLFQTKSGDKIDGEYFTHLFYFRDWIEEFQVIQEAIDKIIIKIVKNNSEIETDLLDIEKKIKMVMGEDCQVIFDYVKDIPKTITGKHRYTISSIQN